MNYCSVSPSIHPQTWCEHLESGQVRALLIIRAYYCRFPALRNATQRIPQPQCRIYRAVPQCRSHWLNVIAAPIGRVCLEPSGVAEKLEVVSICLRSAARSRKRRNGVCGCVKMYRTQQFFCCIKAKIHYTSLSVAFPQQVRNITDKSVTSL